MSRNISERTPFGAFSVRSLSLLLLLVVTVGVSACRGRSNSDEALTSGRGWSVPESAPGGQAFAAELRAEMTQALNRRGADYRPRTHHLNPDGSPVYTNRLIRQTSPYLLQHAHNPVNWYSWGDQAFEDARRLGRPVLLSIGYSTCHWCHVMEKESFEDIEIATFMNENFICIKVDREERPDVDAVYMDAVRMLSGRGGWPMTTVLTPDREVFFGGTYFPARDGDRGSRVGFLTILRRLSTRYQEDHDSVVADARKLTLRLQAAAEPGPAAGLAGVAPLRAAVDALSRSFDSVYGGFGGAPKFPRSVTLDFLMHYYRRSGDKAALHMVSYTLERMSSGGMYDHVGGGFHRYSTDQRWLVPHFEKMLYDNALLVSTYLDAYQITGQESFAATARQTLDYIAREMTSPQGGFYSATDADSPTPAGHEEEGWFFTWTPAEIEEVVGAQAARLVSAYYGVTERGNFEGRNIFSTARPLDGVAKSLGLTPQDARAELEALRSALYLARSKRPPPGKDSKVITSWNGLMISAFARAGRILGAPSYTERARTAADFLLASVMRQDGRLMRTWKDGRPSHDGVLDDYTFLAAGLMDLFEATGERRWLEAAVSFYDVLLSQFWDEKSGGFFSTASDAEKLLVRQKPDYDGAEPSGNSLAVAGLLKLYEFTDNQLYRERAEQSLRAFHALLSRQPTGVVRMLSALDYYLDTPKEIVIVIPDEDAEAAPFFEKLAHTYLPNKVVIVVREGEQVEHMASLLPLVAGKITREGRVTAYVCERRVCKLPTTDPKVFAKQIATVEPYPEG